MNPSDSSTNFITRRDFMKKSALTVGAITLLSQGIGLAAGSGSDFSGTTTYQGHKWDTYVTGQGTPRKRCLNAGCHADRDIMDDDDGPCPG